MDQRKRRARYVAASVEKTLGSLPVVADYCRRLDIAGIIDRACPIRELADLTHGQVIETLIANRLTSPAPLGRVSEWAREWAVAEVFGIDPGMLNDDRAGRALDAVAPELDHIIGSVGAQAISEFGIDVSRLHWDMTSVSLYGAYEQTDDDHPAPTCVPRPAPTPTPANPPCPGRSTRPRWTPRRPPTAGYALLTTLPASVTPAEVLIRYKGQEVVERRYSTIKGPLAVAPMFLKNNRRITALITVICLALLIFCLIERQVRLAIAPQTELAGLYVGRPAKPTGRLIFEALARLRLIPATDGQPPGIPQPPPLQRQLLDLLGVDPTRPR